MQLILVLIIDNKYFLRFNVKHHINAVRNNKLLSGGMSPPTDNVYKENIYPSTL